MSDQQTPPTGISLPTEAISQLQKNVETANTLLNAWDALEKLGVAIPGTKEQLQQVKDTTQALLDNFAPKS